jgi:hypothetical protein
VRRYNGGSDLAAIMWLLLVAACALSTSEVSTSPAHVRPVSASAVLLLTEAAAKSPTVNTLIERLAWSDTIVYVEIIGSPEISLARTKLVAASPAARFLRISINARVAAWDRVALLGHELQHALEIAGAADVRDDEGIRKLYARIGFKGGQDRFETAAARETEWRVRTELAHHVRADATPTTPIGADK